MNWNDRFSGEGYLFGTAPAAFLVNHRARLADGSKVLCVADGEGRNSVFLAKAGHRVTAFDASAVGLGKAEALAGREAVEVTFRQSAVEDWDWTTQFDAVVAIFIQFADPDLREQLFGWLAQAVRPGGLLLVHGYAPRQVDYGTGGPPKREHMYTLPLLEAAFAGWQVLEAADYDAEISEGTGHVGLSGLVDFIARKPVG